MIERRLSGGLIYDSRRGAESKEERVRATGDFDRLGIVAVERNPIRDREVIDRGIWRRHAADSVCLVIGSPGAARIRVAAEDILGCVAVDDHGSEGG